MIGVLSEVFDESYLHGMRRNRKTSLLVPQWLLRLRLNQMVKGQWRAPELEEQPDYPTSPRYNDWRPRVDRLRALHKINPNGLVVFNLIKRGSTQQRLADEDYGMKMMERMAALRHGPLHVGRSIALEGMARFDDVHIVHYPSAGYFSELIASQYFQGILPDKQVADTTWVPTIPFTDEI